MVTLWGMHMRKSFLTLFVVFVYIWSWSIFNVVQQTITIHIVLSHVIKENISGSIDNDAVLKAELDRGSRIYICDYGIIYFRKTVTTNLRRCSKRLRDYGRTKIQRNINKLI